MKSATEKLPEGAFGVFWFALRPYRGPFSLMLSCVIIGNACAASIPYFLKLIADTITRSAAGTFTMSDFAWPLMFVVGALVGQEIFYRLGHFLETYIVVRAYDRVTSAIYEMLLARPTAYFEDKFSGEISRRIEQIGTATKYFIEFFPWEMGWILVTSVVVGVLLSTVHALLIGVFLVWLAIFLFLSYILLSWQSRVSQVVSGKQAALSGTIVDSLGNIALVHSFAAHEYERTYYRTYIDGAIRAEKKERMVSIANKSLQGSSVAVLGGTLVFCSVYLFTKGAIGVGDFVIIAAAVPSMASVIWNFGDNVLRGIRNYGEFKNALESLEVRVPLIPEGARTQAPAHSDITFDDVSFSYPSGEGTVFAHFSLAIKAGERVGFVGRSGAGKSTLVKLLLRQYDPQSGSIRIGDAPVTSFTFPALRSLIAFVPQDTALFHRSLYENISYANPGATRPDIIAASKRAHAHEFIDRFPNKYDTRVGERGVKLSGGERQRIALARAMLKDAPILVLDEATSSLDTESEEIVQEGLHALFRGRTVLAIAHRLSTLHAMDRVIVLDRGQIVEDGSPKELLAKEGGIFRAMWEHQKNGFLE